MSKNMKIKESDLVLIEAKILQEKCGKCDNALTMKTFWSKKGYQQKIECTSCGLTIWKDQIVTEY